MVLNKKNKDQTTGCLLKEKILKDTEDTEIYIVKVPASIAAKSLQDVEIDLKSPSRITIQNLEFSPVVTKSKDLPDSKTIILPGESGVVAAVAVKGIVTLVESVQVPAYPNVEIPQPSKVAHPTNLAGARHPIYGNLDPTRGIKRSCDGIVKKEEDTVVKTEVEDETVKKKKKKKKDKKSEGV